MQLEQKYKPEETPPTETNNRDNNTKVSAIFKLVVISIKFSKTAKTQEKNKEKNSYGKQNIKKYKELRFCFDTSYFAEN